MWLLNTRTFDLHEFIGEERPKYAILSHRWGTEEVSFDEMVAYRKDSVRALDIPKRGFTKIKGCCTQASKDGLEWVWIDSCCIDKRSSAELTEAINSMFAWYKGARFCYVYLEDVEEIIDKGNAAFPAASTNIATSEWFERGWTLQELLAPTNVTFFTPSWAVIGRKSSVEGDAFNLKLSSITGIPEKCLNGKQLLKHTSIAERMFWASQRKTTRPEDMAYSLMGLFDIHMPILYGEGLDKSFYRLQLEIIKLSADQSIFAWRSSTELTASSLLAGKPSAFADSQSIVPSSLGLHDHPSQKQFVMTNVGLRVNLRLTQSKYSRNHSYVAELMCHRTSKSHPEGERIQILLSRVLGGSKGLLSGSEAIHGQLYRRVMTHEFTDLESIGTTQLEEVFVPDPNHWALLTQEAEQQQLTLRVIRPKKKS
jgi:Heterokaryon incompatibility protein (HET)